MLSRTVDAGDELFAAGTREQLDAFATRVAEGST